MKFEYKNNHLILRVLTAEYADAVLSFYRRNREQFDIYETDKPDHFYTKAFIQSFLFDTNFPDKIIGTVSFSDIKKGAFCSCTTGYKIDKEFQHLGYGRRMLTMALKILVTEVHMHRVEAYIAPQNTASISLATKLGFIPEGTAYSYVYLRGKWEDHLRFVYIS